MRHPIRNLNALAEVTVFRVVQRCLTNALRHAHPQRIDVALLATSDRFEAKVVDDGEGFDVSALAIAKAPREGPATFWLLAEGGERHGQSLEWGVRRLTG